MTTFLKSRCRLEKMSWDKQVFHDYLQQEAGNCHDPGHRPEGESSSLFCFLRKNQRATAAWEGRKCSPKLIKHVKHKEKLQLQNCMGFSACGWLIIPGGLWCWLSCFKEDAGILSWSKKLDFLDLIYIGKFSQEMLLQLPALMHKLKETLLWIRGGGVLTATHGKGMSLGRMVVQGGRHQRMRNQQH